MKLTDAKLRALKPTGKTQKLSDGGGLYIHLSPAGGKLWRLFYRFSGKQKTLALGKYPDVSLVEARKRRDEARELLGQGIDPSEKKKEGKAAAVAAEFAKAMTYEVVAREWFAKYSQGWTESNRTKILAGKKMMSSHSWGACPLERSQHRKCLLLPGASKNAALSIRLTAPCRIAAASSAMPWPRAEESVTRSRTSKGR